MKLMASLGGSCPYWITLTLPHVGLHYGPQLFELSFDNEALVYQVK